MFFRQEKLITSVGAEKMSWLGLISAALPYAKDIWNYAKTGAKTAWNYGKDLYNWYRGNKDTIDTAVKGAQAAYGLGKDIYDRNKTNRPTSVEEPPDMPHPLSGKRPAPAGPSSSRDIVKRARSRGLPTGPTITEVM